jgi:hypothetical protein
VKWKGTLLEETTNGGEGAGATVPDWLLPVVVIGLLLVIAVLAGAAVWGLVASQRGHAGAERPPYWLDYGNFFIVALGIVAVLSAFLVALVAASNLFDNPSQILAILTALFGVIGTLVGTYFGVKAGSDAVAGAQNLVGSAITNDDALPTIVSVDPPHNATGVAANTSVTATFSKDMNPATLTNDTFTIAERDAPANTVAGDVSYNRPTKRATFTLSAGTTLTADTTYRATISADVRDQAGSALPVTYAWEFKVA